MTRYSAVALFSHDLERVVLIHKLRPAWQAGKANFPGGKVEAAEMGTTGCRCGGECTWCLTGAHIRCAVREVREETGLELTIGAMLHFCTLRFRGRGDGSASECRFYCAVGDVELARTMESEPVFVADVDDVLDGQVIDGNAKTLPTMGNLPWLVAMARQRLRGDVEWRPGYVVEEVAQ